MGVDDKKLECVLNILVVIYRNSVKFEHKVSIVLGGETWKITVGGPYET